MGPLWVYNTFFKNSNFTLNHSKPSGSDKKCFLSSKQSIWTYKNLFCKIWKFRSKGGGGWHSDQSRFLSYFSIIIFQARQINMDVSTIYESDMFSKNRFVHDKKKLILQTWEALRMWTYKIMNGGHQSIWGIGN